MMSQNATGPLSLHEPGHLKLAVWGALIAVFAVAASNMRITSMPGVEWYVGPAVYLVVVRRWGLWAGLAAALTTMASSLAWWGHPFSILIALGHVAVAHWFCRRTLLAPATLGYAAIVYPLVAFPLLIALHHAPTEAILLVVGRKLLNDVVCAALVDLLFVQHRIFEDGKVIQPRRPMRLVHYFRAWSHLGLLAILAVAFNGATRDFRENFRYARAEQVAAATASLRALPGRPAPGAPLTVTDGYPRGRALAAVAMVDLARPAAWQRLGCRTAYPRAEQEKSFDQILDNCTPSVAGTRPGDIAYILTSDREAATRSYRGTIAEIAPIAALAFALAVALVLVQRDIERNLGDWTGLLAAFGREKLSRPGGRRFEEFTAPLEAFVEANNAYVASAALQAERMKDLKALRASMSLGLLRDISYDPESGTIRCLEFRQGGSPYRRAIVVHPDDRTALQRAMQRDFTVEFRTEGKDADWMTLYARNRRADGVFERGLSFRLRQPRMALSLMRQRARLQDLGLAVAATTHELQQPLFVISLGAEQGTLLAGGEDPDRGVLKALFEKIIGQAQRAQAIVERVSRRAHASQGEAVEEWAPADEVIDDLVNDTRRYAERCGTRIEVENSLEPETRFKLDRTSLEQVLINGVRNAVYAITQRAATSPGPGLVRVRAWRSPAGEVHMAVEDDGVGLTPQDQRRVFNAFYTTKPRGVGTGLGLFIARDIVEEWGGRITLEPRAEGGSVLEFTVPANRTRV